MTIFFSIFQGNQYIILVPDTTLSLLFHYNFLILDISFQHYSYLDPKYFEPIAYPHKQIHMYKRVLKYRHIHIHTYMHARKMYQ